MAIVKPIVIRKIKSLPLGGYLFFLISFLVLLSPTINSLINTVPWLHFIFYLMIGISVFISLMIVRNYDGLALLISGFVFIISSYSQGLGKGLVYSLVLYLSYVGIVRFRRSFLNAVIILSIINYIVVAGQLSGHFQLLYSWADYSNEAMPISLLLDNVSADFLPQMRPAGLYSAHTYLSCFMVLLFSLVILEENKLSKLIHILIGSLFALSGSSLGYVLVALVIALKWRRFDEAKWMVLGYLVTIYCYFIALPEIANYNYSISDFESSILERVLDESIFSQNPWLLFSIILSLGAVFVFGIRKIGSYGGPISALSIILLPVLLHNVISSLMYSVMLGVGVGILSTSLKWRKIKVAIFNLSSNKNCRT